MFWRVRHPLLSTFDRASPVFDDTSFRFNDVCDLNSAYE